MPDSISQRINKGNQLIFEGKIEEASRLVEDLENIKDQTQEEKLSYKLFKAEVYSEMGKDNESLIIVERVFQMEYRNFRSFEKFYYNWDGIRFKQSRFPWGCRE